MLISFTPDLVMFRDRDARLVWFDIRQTGQFVLIAEALSGRPIAALPPMPLAASASRIELPAGSVWLLARLFDGGAPIGAFAGVRIRGGLVELSHAGEIHGAALLITSAITVTLRLDLLPPDQGARSRFGGDANDAVADSPPTSSSRFAVRRAVDSSTQVMRAWRSMATPPA